MSKTLKAWILLLILALIWGSSFYFINNALQYFSPFQVGCLRLSIAGLILFPFIIPQLRTLNKRQLFGSICFGLCNAGLPAFIFAWAQQYVQSSTAGVLNALTPMFNFLVGILFFQVIFKWNKLAGVVIGFIGAIVIINGATKLGIHSRTLKGEAHLIHYLAIVFATFLYGISGNIMAKYLYDVKGYVVSGLSYFSFGIPLLIICLTTTDLGDKIMNIQSVYDKPIYSILGLSVLGSALAIILFSSLVKASNSLFATSVTYLIPFVALCWGIGSKETIQFSIYVGLIMILAGIAIGTIKFKKNKLIKIKKV
ncbi:MAG: DMT family transporter [Bacteroidota bacterium]|nr:DMT family transporter [Bacteroidota bacterium]